jgi:hypothetical protein
MFHGRLATSAVFGPFKIWNRTQHSSLQVVIFIGEDSLDPLLSMKSSASIVGEDGGHVLDEFELELPRDVLSVSSKFRVVLFSSDQAIFASESFYDLGDQSLQVEQLISNDMFTISFKVTLLPRGSFIPSQISSDHPYKCRLCSDTERISCDGCSGTGDLLCSLCGGLAMLDCTDCQGSGYSISQSIAISAAGSSLPIMERLSCKDCVGTGKIECLACSGLGKKRCDSCAGLGDVVCRCRKLLTDFL